MYYAFPEFLTLSIAVIDLFNCISEKIYYNISVLYESRVLNQSKISHQELSFIFHDFSLVQNKAYKKIRSAYGISDKKKSYCTQAESHH